MPTFQADTNEIKNGLVKISGKEAHHLSHVLRMVPGDDLTITDGAGQRFRGTIISCGSIVTVKILEALPSLPSPYPIHLFMALIKGEGLETIVEKAVEMNIEAIHFIATERSILKEISPAKWERLARIAQAAMKQSGRAQPLRLEKPQQMEAACRAHSDLTHFIFLERSQTPTLRKIFSDRKMSPPYGLWIGPEGGWTDQEVHLATKAGCIGATLGPLILRAPTAALHAISSLVAVSA